MEFDPIKLWKLLMDLIGSRPARFLAKTSIYLGWVAFVAWALKIIFDIIKPAITNISETLAFGITLDNAQTVVMSLLVAVVILAMMIVGGQYLFLRVLRKRVAPQWVIDRVAELRSDGISILNDRPTNERGDLNRWQAKWEKWRKEVADYLGDHFTRAEQLSFERLGLIQELPWGTLPISGPHAHYLNQLAKQIAILDTIIERHLNGR